MSGSKNEDYDLSQPIEATSGLKQGLTSYGDAHFSLFLRKVFIKAWQVQRNYKNQEELKLTKRTRSSLIKVVGYSEDALSRPIIGIINTYSSFNPCHANVPQLIEAVKRGVQLKGGLAMDFPTISIHESFASPTSMFLRNLMSMDTEEMIKAQPVDACIMIGGCDKTVPAQLMGGISANKPMVTLLTGPMMPGSYKGARIGACTDCRNNWASYRAGTLDIEDIAALNEELAPTAGTCGVMGTASTMACIVAALGLTTLKGATAPAVSSERLRIAETIGGAAVAIAEAKLLPQSFLTKESFLNAIIVLQAIGGSTNAVVHLMAIINRHPALCGTGEITLATVDEIGRKVPLLIDLKPSGNNYMNDFHNAGGMHALMHTLRPLLYLDARTVTGTRLGDLLDKNPFRSFPASETIIRPLSNPLYPASSLVVLYGNLAPGGAVMKASASKDRRLLSHSGPAVVFRNSADMAQRLDDPELEVTKHSVLVLQGIGAIGNPGMPEAGLIPIPRKLAAEGVTDMLRLSDGRMSGTAGGTIVLHISPESVSPDAVFGVVKDGDIITCDVEKRLLHLEVGDDEIRERLAAHAETSTQTGQVWTDRATARGYRGLYERNVNQAEHGCDFDFLRAVGPHTGDKS